MYSKDDWARMVYAYGDSGQLIHPRHETYRAELDVARTRAITYSAPAQAPAPEPKATPTPGDAPGTPSAPPPVDYIQKP